MIVADTVTVETDEGRYILVINTEEGATLRVDVHSDVFAFYASVQAEIRPYILEAEHARATMPAIDDDGDSGYALDDPKHPTYHDRMVRLSDEWGK